MTMLSCGKTPGIKFFSQMSGYMLLITKHQVADSGMLFI